MLKRFPAAALLVLIPIGVVINVTIGQLVRNGLRLPLYLDSIGTILAGALGGPLIGAVTGALSNVIWGIIFQDSGIIPYAITAACIGVAAGIAAALGAFRRPLSAAVAGLITGVMAALVSAPVTAGLLQGNNGGGAETVQNLLRSTGANVLQAATLQGFLSDPLDKMLSFLAVWLILSLLPATIRQRFAPSGDGTRSYQVPSGYGLAVLLSIVAFGVTIIFLPAFGRSIYSIFFVVVIISAWQGGLGPGLLAMGIGAAANIIVPLFGPNADGLHAEDWLNLLILLAVSFLIVLITDSLERANRAANVALAEQRRSEAEMRAIVDSVVEGLLLVSPDQRLLSVNRQCEELLGITASQVVGQRLDDLRPLVDRIFTDPEGFASRVGESVTDTSARFKETFVQAWPQERQLELVSTPVHSDGRFLGRLYGLRDVTQERELDRMKTEFVSQVSHELRTPLTAIKGFTDLMLDGDAGEVNEEQEEYLQIVKQNVDRLVSLINDLLDVARIESGRIKLKIEAIDLRAIVDLVVATMHPLIDAKDQSLTVEIAPDLPPARGDHDRILQVVTNLVSNAYKYTPAGGALRVEVSRSDDWLQVAVQDTGIGIPPEDIPKLFTRFFRVDTSLTREIGGTGLGLSIVKSIVELHGGTVSVQSTPGSGSTFSFDIPIAVEVTPQGAPMPAPESIPVGGPVADGRTVLVVEDDETVSGVIAASLDRAGYHVETAGSVEAALGCLDTHKPDLIVLSVRLPDLQGLDRTSRLADTPELRDIPMLVLSILEENDVGGTTPPEQMDEERLLAHVHRALAAPDRGRILVIDDDPSVRELLIVALRKQGFEVLEAPDGETGLVLAGRAEPGLILLDLRLPGMDGFAVLQALKRSPETAEIPVIAISGSTGLWLGARARVLSLGAADFVAKPFEMTELIGEIQTLMQDKEETHADSRASR